MNSRPPPTLAIATCREFPGLYPDDHPLLAALVAAGISAEPVIWDAEVNWPHYSAVLLRSVWDYFEKADAFTQWLDGLERHGIPCWNPVSLVRWNMDKRYLRDLEAKGIAVAPTLWFDRAEGLSSAEVAARIVTTGWTDVVVKPSVSGGAWRTLRLTRAQVPAHADAIAEILSTCSLLAQPFLPEIVEQGELSMLFFGGQYSHAVVKRPRAGDFRVQWSHGGSHAATTPSPAIIEQARAVLAAAPSPGLYARVDGVVRDGRLILMELEQIEPYLFFAEDPRSVDRFVEALRARLLDGR